MILAQNWPKTAKSSWHCPFNVASLSRDYLTWSQVSIYSKGIYLDTLHIDWKSGTAISCYSMYLKFRKRSKQFSGSLTKDVVIAFRMTGKLFSFRNEVPNGWIIIRNGTTKFGLFPDLISVLFLGATDLFITDRDKLNISVWRPKTSQIWFCFCLKLIVRC